MKSMKQRFVQISLGFRKLRSEQISLQISLRFRKLRLVQVFKLLRISGNTSTSENSLMIYLQKFSEIIEPALNLYCYIEKRLYVREIFTLKITIKNPTKNILHLQATFNSADGFMFSGHRQVSLLEIFDFVAKSQQCANWGDFIPMCN